MEAICLVLATGAVCIWSFALGAKVGQAVKKGEPVEMPKASPMEAYKEHRAKKEAQMEQNRLDIIMQNIEGYDGTGFGQEDVPGR